MCGWTNDGVAPGADSIERPFQKTYSMHETWPTKVTIEWWMYEGDHDICAAGLSAIKRNIDPGGVLLIAPGYELLYVMNYGDSWTDNNRSLNSNNTSGWWFHVDQ